MLFRDMGVGHRSGGAITLVTERVDSDGFRLLCNEFAEFLMIGFDLLGILQDDRTPFFTRCII
jgi:hypothetical protein